MRLIASRGLRGLTHRAVDQAAGLPPGSTSYHARTRARLIEVTLRRMADEEGVLEESVLMTADHDLGTLADLVAEFTHTAIHRDRDRMLARYELALEATRRPELRPLYDRVGARFRALARTVARALGSPDPERHARDLIAWADGVIFDSVAGAASACPPSLAELRRSARDLLSAQAARSPRPT
ncbi:TetR family transcriptional regulator [Marinitenerispora sediminis]|uniref:TetR family transcriptional regulator n=2 Tax=Marinitenerispora sediminis TaxID=1931232 RepID=A0A368T8Y4_9ACTN|nr:TetR family transcriptional regulator [Marinitenerispora sediminis]RCV55949.1 TetR family transcriptional regulator [Marinitenerispora sediminis]RCV60683.1 TetR family transcriptional regulator [Marinitenerispora sediminis]